MKGVFTSREETEGTPGITATLTAVRMPEETIPITEILLEEAVGGRMAIPPESVSEGRF